MACEFQHVREVPLPLVADANPNVTPPAAPALLSLNHLPVGGENSDMNAVGLYFRGLTAANVLVTPGTASYTLWAKDGGGSFVKIGTGVAVADLDMQSHACPLGAQLFVQVTATGGFAGATKLQARVTERAA